MNRETFKIFNFHLKDEYGDNDHKIPDMWLYGCFKSGLECNTKLKNKIFN